MKPLFTLSLILALPASAALTWTGGGDGISLFQEANFTDDNGATPAANEINPNTALTAATGGLVDISSGTGSPNNFGGNFVLPTGTSLNVAGKTLGGSGNISGGGTGTLLSVGIGGTARAAAFSLFSDITINGGSILTNATGGFNTVAGPSSITMTNGATADLQFISNTFTLTLDGTSSINFKGGGNPINGGTVDLQIGGVVTFTDETPTAFTTEHLSKFFVDGAAGVIGTNLSVVSDGGTGSIVTAIPEPSTAALGALGFLALLRRRR